MAVLAPSRKLWTPPPRRILSPPGVRDFARWRRSVPVRNSGKVQQNATTRKVIQTIDTNKVRRSSSDPCDCGCVTTNYIQWRKCSDDSLQDLWSPDNYPIDPLTGEPSVFPYGMILREDGLCYYHDETDPTSTTPGRIVFPVSPPTYTDGDFVFLPEGWACTDLYCSPHTCPVTCELGITPAAILLDFSGITLPYLGCVTCSPDVDLGCLGTGTSIDGSGDASLFNKKFVCMWLGDEACCYSAFPAGAGLRTEVYGETFYDWPGCGAPPDPGCSSDPYDIWHDFGAEDPNPTYFDVQVCLGPGYFTVSIMQTKGGSIIYFFFAQIPFASEARCDLPVSAAHDPSPLAPGDGGVCSGAVRGSGGFVNVVPLV